MNKLIILPDNKLIVSDEDINVGDWYYTNLEHDPSSVTKCKTIDKSKEYWLDGGLKYLGRDFNRGKGLWGSWKITASEKPLEGVPLIDPKQVESLLPRTDVHKQAVLYAVSKDYNVSDISVDGDYAHQAYLNMLDMYREGYNEATKVYKYTEKQLKEAFQLGQVEFSNNADFEKFIASLASPIKEGQEYEVEIEMETYYGNSVSSNDNISHSIIKVNKEGYVNITKLTPL